MISPLRSGRIVGALLIAHLLTGLIIPYVFLLPLTAPPAAFLELASAVPSMIRLNLMFLFLGSAAAVVISLMVWPLLRTGGQTIGCALFGLAGMAFCLQLVENIHWLTLLSVSEAYATVEAAEAAAYTPAALAVRAAFRWAHYSHILIAVSWLLAFSYVSRKAGLVPPILSGAGIATALLHIGGVTLPAFAGYGAPFGGMLGAPLAFAILAIGGWLAVKGFEG